MEAFEESVNGSRLSGDSPLGSVGRTSPAQQTLGSQKVAEDISFGL